MSIRPTIHNTNIVKSLLAQKLQNGNIVVDATMGNGNDTLFLCKKVLPKGKVYAFDIQEDALINTTKLLQKHNFSSNLNKEIQCIKDSHANFDRYFSEPVDVFMYNLGYLPGGDHSIITRPKSTMESLELATKKLKEGGIISIIIYYGHTGGEIEKRALENFLQSLSAHQFKIFQGMMPFNDHFPPIMYLIEKLQRKKQPTK